MVVIGKRNTLRVVKDAAPGLYLDGGEHLEILLPGRYIPKGTKPGDTLDVFIYLDSEDRLVATTETPLAMVGEFAWLKVISVNHSVGAFLDWGLAKDLLLPFREQEKEIRSGQRVFVFVFLDPTTNRIVATTRLNKHLNLVKPPYIKGQPVNLLITDKTPLGYNAIVENAHRGLLYHSNLAKPLTPGQKLKGYIRTVRPDGKIDLSLDASGYTRVAPLTEQIMTALKTHKGPLPFDDASSPEAIRAKFACSKGAFKQALGALYKQRLIRFKNPGIELAEPPAPAATHR